MRFAAVLILALLAACSGGSGGDNSAAGGYPAEATSPDDAQNTTTVTCTGTENATGIHCLLVEDAREFYVHFPNEDTTATGLPVVFYIHGGFGNAEHEQRLSEANPIADREGFIAVYPQGEGVVPSWNGGECCGPAQKLGIDDVGYFEKILDFLEQQFAIDTSRVYATGLSNGGIMSYRLACDLSHRFAAIAPIAGSLERIPCDAQRPVPVLHFHGTEDTRVPLEGGMGTGAANHEFQSLEYSTGTFADINGCSAVTDVTYQTGEVTCTTRADCDEGAEVTVCIIEGGGHTWPGGQSMDFLGHTTTDIDATEYGWQFFQRFRIQ